MTAFRWPRRIGPDEGNMCQAVILLGTLEQQSVFAEMVTMVGCVDLHGVISNAGILRRGTIR